MKRKKVIDERECICNWKLMCNIEHSKFEEQSKHNFISDCHKMNGFPLFTTNCFDCFWRK